MTTSTGIFCSAGGSPAKVSWELSCSDGTWLSGGAPYSSSSPIEVALGALCTLALAGTGSNGCDGATWMAPDLRQRFSLPSGAFNLSETFVVKGMHLDLQPPLGGGPCTSERCPAGFERCPAGNHTLLAERDDLVARLPRRELEKAPWGRLDSAKFFLIEPNSSVCHPASSLKSSQYGLPEVLLPRLRASPLRTLNPGEARVAYLAYPAWLFVDAHQGTNTSCDACSETLSTALRESQWHGERIFLSVGVPAPKFVSELRSHERSRVACGHLWGAWRTLVKPAETHVLSIEGFTPTPNRTHCASGCQWEHAFRNHRFEDDWSLSVPYPNSVSLMSPRFVAARNANDVTAHQKRLRQAARPGLLGWLFKPGLQDEVERLKAGERTTLRAKIRDTLPAHRLNSPHEYGGVRYCLMPAGTTPSRDAFFQAMAAGCVPVVFSHSFECPFYDMAYQLNLPMRRARSGWGPGEYSVVIDSVLAGRDAHHILAVLNGIDERTYLKMRDRVIDLLPRITYFPVAVPGVSDAVDAILEALLSFSKP